MDLRVVPLFVALGALAMARPASAEDARAPQKPTPAWADEVPIDAPPPDPNAERGVTELLIDDQLHAQGEHLEWYTRRAFRVETTAGVESSSELRFDFDPKFRRLALHHVRIVRGGAVIDALAGGDWQVIQPENDRERRVYSGELEGLLFLHDVRVGDVVDYAYSTDNRGPLAPGRVAGRFSLADRPVSRERWRLVVSDGRRLLFKLHDAPAAVESTAGGDHAYLWDRRAVTPPPFEDDTPGWYVAGPSVDISDFGTWHDVAAAVSPLFAATEPLPAAATALVAGWKKLPGEGERALAATTFVQDEIRYLGIEMGPHSHQPFAPELVFARRFGDCKDKALLLVAMLRALGLRADVALVSTTQRRQLDDRLPSPFVFDHAIVRAVVDGAVRWIDATESFARGALATRRPPPFERALVMAPDATGLETIETVRPSAPTYEEDETYTVTPTPDAPVRLEVRTTYRGEDADAMRAQMARTPVAELGRQYFNYYARKYPKIADAADPTFTDDPVADVLVVHESYSLGGFFADGDRSLWPEAVEKQLVRPRIVRRTAPLGVSYPTLVAHHTHVKLANTEGFKPLTDDVADDSVRFHAQQSIDPDGVTLDYRFETLADSVPADKVTDHLAVLDKIRDGSEFRVDPTAARTTPPPPKKSDTVAWTITFCLLGFAVFGYVFVRAVEGLRQRRRRTDYRRRSTAQTGEGPANPIAVKDEGEIAAHFAKTRCTCGAPLGQGDGAPPTEDVRLGERVVRVARTECKSCGAARRTYFELRATSEAG